MQWKALVVALLLGATLVEPASLEAQSAATVIPAPAGPHVIITVPVQLVNVPKETSSVVVSCAVKNAVTGRDLPKWIEVPIQSPTVNGSGIDWSTTATMEFTLIGQTLSDLQNWKDFFCNITLHFTSLGAFYGSRTPYDYNRGLKSVDIPLGPNSPQQTHVIGTITW